MTNLQGHRFLYVEDDLASRVGMKMIFSRVLGIEDFIMFEDSVDFMQRVKALEPQPDVILLDIHIEPINGFAMLALLRSDPVLKNCKIIALTASVMNQEVSLLRESGFDGTIAKPLDVLTFTDLLERIVQGESVWHIA